MPIADVESKAMSAYEKHYVAAFRASLWPIREWNKTIELGKLVAAIRSLLEEQQEYYQNHVDFFYVEILDTVGFRADNVNGRMK